MSAITDWAAQEQADLTAISTTLDGVVAGIANLDTLITNFQNSPGTLSASDQAALDGIKAASAALVTKAGAISVTPPAPTDPELTAVALAFYVLSAAVLSGVGNGRGRGPRAL